MSTLEPIKATRETVTYRLTLIDGTTLEKVVPRTQDGFREANKWAASFGRFRHF